MDHNFGCAFPRSDHSKLNTYVVESTSPAGHNFRLDPSSGQKNLLPAHWGSGFQTDACGYPIGTLCDLNHSSDVTVL